MKSKENELTGPPFFHAQRDGALIFDWEQLFKLGAGRQQAFLNHWCRAGASGRAGSFGVDNKEPTSRHPNPKKHSSSLNVLQS